MQRVGIVLIFLSLLSVPSLPKTKGSPFAGRWDFTLTTSTGTRAVWLGVTEKAGALEVWFQPTGGNVYQVKDFKAEGSHLVLTLSPASGNRPASTIELDVAGDKITGVQKRGGTTTQLAGVRAPEL